MRRSLLISLVFGALIACCAVSTYAADNQQNQSISQFLTPDRRFDLVAARTAGFQGQLELSGCSVQIDPATGEPLIRPKPAEIAASRTEDTCWADIGSAYSGVDYEVYCMTVFQGKLIVGGAFHVAGGVLANHIAAWDGVSWSPLALGVDSAVTSMMVWGDKLVVGGAFLNAGGAPAVRIATWDGSTWAPIGVGLGCQPNSMVVYHDKLYVGANYFGLLHRWDDTCWAWIGKNLRHDASDCISAMIEYNDQLLVAGNFGINDTLGGQHIGANFAYLDDSILRPYGPTPKGAVWDLAMFDGKLIAGGNFSAMGDDLVHTLAAWDGTSWSSVGGEVQCQDTFYRPEVFTLAINNGELVVGGWFDGIGGVSSRHIISWDGDVWHPLGEGVTTGPVFAVAPYGSLLYAGGRNFYLAGQTRANGITAWNGSAWVQLGTGTDASISAATVFQDKLVVAGGFTSICGVPANGVAAWDGTHWSPLGEGVNVAASSLIVYDGKLIVAGGFTTAGGQPANYIAAWDGSSWSPLGEGLDRAARVMTIYNSKLCVGGWFTHAGGVPVNHIATWDGTSWSTLGSGISMTWGGIGAMETYGGLLYVGGMFPPESGETPTVLKTWNGTDWTEVDVGPSAIGEPVEVILSMGTGNGQLVVGGNYVSATKEQQNACVKLFDGSTWRNLDSNLPVPRGFVLSLLPYNNELVAAGWWFNNGNFPNFTDGLFSYDVDAGTWSSLGSGVNGLVDDIEIYDSTLWVVGAFSIAGGHVSANIAKWTGGSCGEGVTGNVNMVGIVDLSDLSMLTSYLLQPNIALPCEDEANINAKGIIDVSDLSLLVQYLLSGNITLPLCQ